MSIRHTHFAFLCSTRWMESSNTEALAELADHPAPYRILSIYPEENGGPYNSLGALAARLDRKELSFIGDRLYNTKGAQSFLEPGTPGRWVIKDVMGRSLPPRILWAFMAQQRHQRLRARLAGALKGYSYRRGPVPGTGRRGGGSYFRSPRSTQEKRSWHAACDDDGERIPARAKRSPRGLPNAWDDIPFARRGESWKNYRRTQYKT